MKSEFKTFLIKHFEFLFFLFPLQNLLKVAIHELSSLMSYKLCHKRNGKNFLLVVGSTQSKIQI